MSNRLTKRLPKADVARISMRRNLHTLKPFVAWDEFEQIKEPESKRVLSQIRHLLQLVAF